MSNTLVRLKRQTDTNGEDQVVIKVQYKQKQYPIPIPNLKVKPKYFEENNYGNWLTKSYSLKDGISRSKVKINSKIKSFKTKVDVALDNLEEVGIDKLNVALVKGTLGKSFKEIKEKKEFIIDSFYEEDFITVYKEEFLKDPFVENDLKNLEALLVHLNNYNNKLKAG